MELYDFDLLFLVETFVSGIFFLFVIFFSWDFLLFFPFIFSVFFVFFVVGHLHECGSCCCDCCKALSVVEWLLLLFSVSCLTDVNFAGDISDMRT